MATGISTPADVVNLALHRVGSPRRIGSLYDGSIEAKLALDFYGQTRDQLIREGEWEFAERLVVGTLLKQAPPAGYFATPWSTAYPALPWQFEYAFPADCLKLRSVRPAPVMIPNYDPIHNIFSVENDNAYAPPEKVVLCNVQGAILTYAGQVTDPTTWEADFIEALAAALARRFAPVLANLETTKFETQDEQGEGAVAADQKG